MSIASSQLPCKSCLANGKANGSVLTLDGECSACWDGGEALFKQTVKDLREQLKNDMQRSRRQDEFISAYGKAKAAGVSEGVLKKLCMLFQESSSSATKASADIRNEANVKPKETARKRSELGANEEDGDTEERCAKRRSTSSALVNITLGMSGVEAQINLEACVTMNDVRNALRPEAGERFVKFSSEGEVLTTPEAIIGCKEKGKSVFATFLPNTTGMSLEMLQNELSLNDSEFQGHFHILRHFPVRFTPGDVARYLWDNQILLTATQAQRVFDALVGKLSRATNPRCGRSGPRAQLILALHSFCLEAHAIWEPNDDCDECLWANMRWGKHTPSDRYHLRGNLVNITSTNHSASASAAGREDVSKLSSVVNARRDSKIRPLESMKFLTSYDYSWRALIE